MEITKKHFSDNLDELNDIKDDATYEVINKIYSICLENTDYQVILAWVARFNIRDKNH